MCLSGHGKRVREIGWGNPTTNALAAWAVASHTGRASGGRLFRACWSRVPGELPFSTFYRDAATAGCTNQARFVVVPASQGERHAPIDRDAPDSPVARFAGVLPLIAILRTGRDGCEARRWLHLPCDPYTSTDRFRLHNVEHSHVRQMNKNERFFAVPRTTFAYQTRATQRAKRRTRHTLPPDLSESPS